MTEEAFKALVGPAMVARLAVLVAEKVPAPEYTLGEEVGRLMVAAIEGPRS